jgi:hypothetical protein
MIIVKEEARKIIDNLPDDASWDDVMYEFYVRKKVDRGLKDIEEGKIIPHDEIKKKFMNK